MKYVHQNNSLQNNAFLTNWRVLLLFLTLVSACANQPAYKMSPETASNPATTAFLDYVNAARIAANFGQLSPFFSPSENTIIERSIGWQLFVYSASYTALKNGKCLEIKAKSITAKRVQLDCIGKFNHKSVILGDSQEEIHLRVFMVFEHNKWFASKAGYVHTQEGGTGKQYSRVGLKFKSVFDQVNQHPSL